MNDILLVDDEPTVLQNLYLALDWSEYGFRHVHTAGSAEEAMRLMKENLIDLIILDIQMPRVTGLEMLKQVRAKYPNTHCILISAHSKFEYAKEALRLNVENYLLKPIDINELRETVTHAAENIAKDSAASHNLFERNLLERWLYGRITSDELMEHSQYTQYNVLLRDYCAVIVHRPGGAALPLRQLTAALPPDICAWPLTVDDSMGILLLGGHDVSDGYVRAAAPSVTAAYPGTQIVCGSCATGSGNVSKSLADARHALEYARLAGCSGFLSFSQIDWNPFSPAQLTGLNDLLQMEPSEKQVSSFTAGLTGKPANPEHAFCSLYAHICLALLHMTETPDRKQPALLPLTAPYSREHLDQAVVRAVQQLHSSKQQSTQNLSPIIQRVVRYIRDNLSSSISIKQFCEQTNMNPTYIGRLFKEELGMYFSEYVCVLRVNKAKLLLENTTLSVSDIARQVGIYDVSYFVQCFKKQERTSPMKYRQAVLQNKK
ncbi:MAG: response regulator [Lachnospiraceae bacterium]|nr:response regulator [Lachnospiraceae bacterium]